MKHSRRFCEQVRQVWEALTGLFLGPHLVSDLESKPPLWHKKDKKGQQKYLNMVIWHFLDQWKHYSSLRIANGRQSLLACVPLTVLVSLDYWSLISAHQHYLYNQVKTKQRKMSTNTKKRKILTIETKRQILDDVDKRNMMKKDIAAKNNIPHNSLSTIIKNTDKIAIQLLWPKPCRYWEISLYVNITTLYILDIGT